MLKKIGLFIGLLIAVFVAVGLFLPTQYAVSRDIVIDADKKTIHGYVGELTNWPLWTPWQEMDPSVVVTLSEKTAGIGASQSWTSNDGGGSLTFTSSSPDVGIKYDLFFSMGGGAENDKSEAAMLYHSEKEQTRVVWSMEGEMTMPVIGGYFAAMMDSMAGGMLEKGMTKLKQVAEKG